GNSVDPFAPEILGFLNSRHKDDYVRRYVERCRHLNDLQAAFELCGQYSASTYSEVRPIDHETYRISLLLSIITTNHRFEILQWLIEFLQMRLPDVPRTILSIGFGSGYEVKLIQDYCPAWEIMAFDNAAASYSYASDLLQYFGHDTECLRRQPFPLE